MRDVPIKTHSLFPKNDRADIKKLNHCNYTSEEVGGYCTVVVVVAFEPVMSKLKFLIFFRQKNIIELQTIFGSF